MIQLELTTALALYSGLVCIGALIIWLYTELAAYRRHRSMEKQNLWKCAYCRYIYLDELAASVSECPRCKSFNSVEDKLARYVKPTVAQSQVETGEDGEAPRRNPSRRKRPGTRRRGPRRRR